PDTGQVTVGVDALGEPAHLLTTAFREARSRGVGLRVVHAWHYSVYDDVVFPGAEARRHSDQLTDQIRAHLDPVAATFADVPVELVVRQARPADALVAESEGSALLVVGRHRTSLPVAHLGSIGRAVLRESRCPVMIVDPVGEAQPA
ncbi:universal stress protein, partial [Nocardioides pyridinolyticus]